MGLEKCRFVSKRISFFSNMLYLPNCRELPRALATTPGGDLSLWFQRQRLHGALRHSSCRLIKKEPPASSSMYVMCPQTGKQNRKHFDYTPSYKETVQTRYFARMLTTVHRFVPAPPRVSPSPYLGSGGTICPLLRGHRQHRFSYLPSGLSPTPS
jgi:hypothetical protein